MAARRIPQQQQGVAMQMFTKFTADISNGGRIKQMFYMRKKLQNHGV